MSAARWFIVGSTTFVIDTSLFLLVFNITEIAVLSNLFSGTVAVIFNYSAHHRWSFKSNRRHRESLLIYLSVVFSFMLLGTTALTILIHIGVSPVLAKVGLAIFTAPISFFISKFVTFRRTTTHEA